MKPTTKKTTNMFPPITALLEPKSTLPSPADQMQGGCEGRVCRRRRRESEQQEAGRKKWLCLLLYPQPMTLKPLGTVPEHPIDDCRRLNITNQTRLNGFPKSLAQPLGADDCSSAIGLPLNLHAHAALGLCLHGPHCNGLSECRPIPRRETPGCRVRSDKRLERETAVVTWDVLQCRRTHSE